MPTTPLRSTTSWSRNCGRWPSPSSPNASPPCARASRRSPDPMASIENLILANHVEAINGLLYVHGGGFTDINRVVPEGQPALVHLGIGVTILVPWTETNRPYHLGIWVEPEDGGQQLFAVDSDIEAGRPAGIPEGSDIRAVIGLAGEVVFPA